MRALTFASGQYVDYGSPASLDNLAFTGGALTVWAEVYRTSNGANQHIMTKDNAFPGGPILSIDNGFAEGELRFIVPRATTHTDFISNSSNIVALNTWTFVAGTFDDAASPKIRLYMGTMTTALAEVSGYAKTDAGTGAMLDDSAVSWYLGNLQRNTAFPIIGRISSRGLLNRALTPGELQVLQHSRRRHRAGTVSLSRCGENGTGTQPDLSGNGNTGAVTGATVSDGPPGRRP